jgi:ribosomal-protein-alanine N-acetyltransferase
VNDAEKEEVLILRRMQLDDIPAVHALDVMSFSLPWTQRSYQFELTENKTSRPWVAEVEKNDGCRQIVAMMVIWIILDEAHIATIATHPDYRQRKIGERLLARGILEACKEGALKVFLEVRRGNLAAQAMYFKFGFVTSGSRPRYYRDTGEDALLMTLEPINLQELERLV